MSRSSKLWTSGKLLAAVLVTLAGAAQFGCRACSNCYDYSSPVAGYPCEGCDGCGVTGRSGSTMSTPASTPMATPVVPTPMEGETVIVEPTLEPSAGSGSR